MKYLSPTADLTFKRVFGEHPDLLISMLNAMLPLPQGEEIVNVEYLPGELVPENPLKKDSIVDVRCRERDGRQFIVEMQLEWTTFFMQRVLFNASKAYVRQLDRSEHYEMLQPVYALSFVGEIFEPDMETFYHHYSLVHSQDSGKVIDGLQLVFIELPKFKPTTYSEKKMRVLWLRFLTEIDEKTRIAPPELTENPYVSKALNIVEEAAYTEPELEAYDRYWDAVRTEKTLISGKRREGLEEGLEKGRQEGLEEGLKKGKLEDALKLKAAGMSNDFIAGITGLSSDEIETMTKNG